MKNIKNKGFTLIELLVVISIIGILAAMTMTGLAAAQKNARDAARKSDLNQYRIAVESYNANNGSYPNSTIPSQNGNSQANTGIWGASSVLINEYIAEEIADPRAGSSTCFNGATACQYNYFSDANGNAYVLWANLENSGSWEICSTGKTGLVAAIPLDQTCDL